MLPLRRRRLLWLFAAPKALPVTALQRPWRGSSARITSHSAKFLHSGMAALGAWVHNLTVPGKGKVMRYGLYTSRGEQQCDTPEYRERCMHTPPNPTAPNPTSGWTCEGSHGYEKRDAAWLVKAGADYVKVDSC